MRYVHEIAYAVRTIEGATTGRNASPTTSEKRVC